MLQPIDSIPADAAKHKFMVQSCYAPSEGVDIDAFWKVTVQGQMCETIKIAIYFVFLLLDCCSNGTSLWKAASGVREWQWKQSCISVGRCWR